MPRRSPGELNTPLLRRSWQLAPPPRPGRIAGLSASACHQVASFERLHGLTPGQVARALQQWADWGRCARADRWRFGWQFSPPFADGRALLEAALARLRRPARRQLRAVLAPLDERFRARTVPDPFAAPDEPWWRRRTE